MKPRACFAGWMILSLLTSAAARAFIDERVTPKGPRRKSMEFAGAENHLRVPFLQPERDWERVDIYVPKEAGAERLPCIILYYGGGYGDKVLPEGKAVIEKLLEAGYVVAVPDYVLGAGDPVPICAWDAACAIRFLRSKAGDYRIDPKRIGVWGFSAGGWIVQHLCYADASTLVSLSDKRGPPEQRRRGLIPVIEPRPLYADEPIRVQAVVTDWGAGKLWDRRKDSPHATLSRDDPPLFTVYSGAPAEIGVIKHLQPLGVPAGAVFIGENKNTHCPSIRTPGKDLAGHDTTWGDGILAFLDRHVKNPTLATAPELYPHGGAIAGPTEVTIRTVHADATIHYTLDGRDPTTDSPVYRRPVVVKPGQQLKAIAVKPGLAPSRVAAAAFPDGPPRPWITTRQIALTAKVGKPFRAQFEADGPESTRWLAAGMLGERWRELDGQRFNPPRSVAWMSMDPETGILSGTPRFPGVYPVIVSAWWMTGDDVRFPEPAAADARRVVVVVQP